MDMIRILTEQSKRWKIYLLHHISEEHKRKPKPKTNDKKNNKTQVCCLQWIC